jgi:hypothetical protein
MGTGSQLETRGSSLALPLKTLQVSCNVSALFLSILPNHQPCLFHHYPSLCLFVTPFEPQSSSDASCSTLCFRIYLPNSPTLPQLKHLARAIIHFEPAIKALAPATRGAKHCTARSCNVAAIETYNNTQAVITFMHPNNTTYHGFNLLGINAAIEHSIEFHPGSVTWTTEGIFQLATLAMAFVQASFKLGGRDVTMLPHNVSGLKQFLDDAKVVKAMGSDGIIYQTLGQPLHARSSEADRGHTRYQRGAGGTRVQSGRGC